MDRFEFNKAFTEVGILEIRNIISEKHWRCPVELTVQQADILNYVCVKLAASLVSKEAIDETTDVTWPRDWVEAFRERWFPEWWLKRWPVKYTVRTICRRVTRMCPHLGFPENSPVHLTWLTTGQDPTICGYCERRRAHEQEL